MKERKTVFKLIVPDDELYLDKSTIVEAPVVSTRVNVPVCVMTQQEVKNALLQIESDLLGSTKSDEPGDVTFKRCMETYQTLEYRQLEDRWRQITGKTWLYSF